MHLELVRAWAWRVQVAGRNGNRPQADRRLLRYTRFNCWTLTGPALMIATRRLELWPREIGCYEIVLPSDQEFYES
jgi:hypothetical protein